MTTDVINGVPRSLLADLLSDDREKRVPAERHLYAILANATAQPAADGEREAAPGWAHWAAGDTVRYVSSGGFIHARMTVDSDYLIHEAPDDCESMLVLDDDGDELSVLVGEFEWQARAVQPQQAVAVTDEVRRLREALEHCKDELRWMIDKHNAQSQEDGSWLYDYQTVAEADAALAAHKTGEEE